MYILSLQKLYLNSFIQIIYFWMQLNKIKNLPEKYYILSGRSNFAYPGRKN